MALSVTEIQQLYTAYLGRPADRAGIDYWQEQNVSEFELRANLANDNQPEYVEMYGDRTRAELVESIYQNMFGRDADEEGLDYWVNGDGASVPASELQQLFISAASEEDRAAFDERVSDDIDSINAPEAPEATDTIDVTFNTSTTGNSEEIFGTFETTTDGELVQIALPSLAIPNQQQTVTSIGKAEWDEAGQVVTTSADYTFNMSNQLGAGKEYTGEFLSPLLTSESRSADSQLFIELLDIRAAGTDEPLGNLPIDGIRFQVDGEETVLRSDDIFNAKTYPELLSAIRDAIIDNDDLAGFTAEIGSSFTATDGGEPIPGAVGSTIILTDAQGREISGGSFTYSDQETGGFTLYGDLSTEAPESVRELISTNLDLDNVGYGSQGGTINLAGESNTDKGVEEFNVDAEDGVWLTRLESQTISGTQALKEINLDGSGYFRVGQQSDQNVFNIAQLMTQAAVSGVALAQSLEASAGLVDVEKVNAQEFGGEVKLNAYLTDDVIERDMNLQDNQADPAGDNVNYTYQTAGGNDQISLIVEEGVLQREDALLNINAGNGNNVVETLIVDETGRAVESVNQQLNQDFGAEQVTIVTGNGDDVVRTWGAGDATINTGAGNDVIYADNSGLLGVNGVPLEDGATRWEFNSTASGDAPTGVSNSNADLSDGANGTEQVFSDAFDLQVRVDFKGFESSWINVPHAGNQTTSLEVNQAIKDAVNNDAVLQHLIQANDGNGNILDIVSLIDGDNLSDLTIDFRGPEDNDDFDTDSLDAIRDIYTADGAGDDATDSVVGEVAGVDSSVESDNTINAGNGNDVIVLGTGENSNDTIVLEDNFGRNSIVNFIAGSDSEDDDSFDAGYDILDFTNYLGGSANFGDAIGDDRSVVVTDDFDYESGVSWGSLSESDVAAEYEDQAGSDFDSILMVEATGGGAGQYKAFHVSSTDGSEDVSVDLLGVLDFGATQDFNAANFA
ncbi:MULTISPECIES: DUF4214 domain-containing protein [unclassified Halomonas]|uniref:DUF4214 domain-containing protein n=1 Tax=unclassified Halomonas TaxID=2609666 RepID=UPI0020768AD9|nr:MULTISPECIES: DUF4214 domain-containing protein [unclassified Halomonas]